MNNKISRPLSPQNPREDSTLCASETLESCSEVVAPVTYVLEKISKDWEYGLKIKRAARRNARSVLLSHCMQDASCLVIHRAAAANQICKVISQLIWQKVDTFRHLFGSWEYELMRFAYCEDCSVSVHDFAPPRRIKATVEHTQNHLDSGRRSTYLVEKKPSKNSGIRLSFVYPLLMLLTGNPCCFPCNFSGSFRSSVRLSCNAQCSNRGQDANDNGCQFREVSPINRKRTNLHHVPPMFLAGFCHGRTLAEANLDRVPAHLAVAA